MTRPYTTPESQAAPQPGGPINESARAHVSDEIVTGVPHPRERARYTGFDWVATLLGFAVAMFFLAVFVGIVAAVMGSLGYRPVLHSLPAAVSGPNGEAAAAAGLAATFLAYVIGGYAAGRVARFNGGRNGLGVVLWTLIVAVLVGIAGAVLELAFPGVARSVRLNTLAVSLRAEAVSVAIVAVPALVVMIVAGPLGGALGTRYHRRVDRAMGVPAL